jgi:hypothetical protein
MSPPTPNPDTHTEGFAIGCDLLSDSTVAPYAQSVALQLMAYRALPKTGMKTICFRYEMTAAGQYQAPGQLGRGRAGATAFGDRDAALGTRCQINVASELAGLADEPQIRQLVQQWGCYPGSFPGEDKRLRACQALRQRGEVFRRVVEHRHLVLRQSREALEMPYAVLVIIRYDNAHGLRT